MPLAVDTNVLARALVDDGSDQSKRAQKLLTDEEIFIADTVLLETEWLMRSVMNVAREDIGGIFAVLVATENIFFADRGRVANCILAHQAGLDFADAMHLYAAAGNDAFATFDTGFRRKSKRLASSVPVIAA
ncbi:MAG: type II toxin-antitoxin system VapC family toxin [Neoaquamicrobium sediminum]|uniref:Type II toxin-antitoxin system VapC family toxin n=1 Tax=Neoaquamicrobium sediminum TaxID=1849104 RepID=A0ABV3WSK1_9HYPH|nr:type II toxin-antitoxin system VapC family toxin [Mesorhizobium sediminum]MBX9451339.1 PIN domain-containing protein [Mesorhizobium sp.]NRC54658.1 type II toxin-antitoxin system VapC family toxin [Mesorhizobium sediminum]